MSKVNCLIDGFVDDSPCTIKTVSNKNLSEKKQKEKLKRKIKEKKG